MLLFLAFIAFLATAIIALSLAIHSGRVLARNPERRHHSNVRHPR
jgi:hypothetical protein